MARTYSSDLRAERARLNRSAVVNVARTMFVERGWVATTMSDVASAAGLTRQTVYQQFDAKLTLLDACIDLALSDGADSPVRELPAYLKMGEGSIEDRLAAGVSWLRGAHERSATIQHVLDEAAVVDDVAAVRLEERERTRWDEVRWASGLILGSPPADAVVDAMWMLTSRSVWLRLTRERGWTPEQWEGWFIRHASEELRG
ncbi:TetR/AcrR family transcriptional regulator [Dietzia sp. SLG310A2-38A2]|uniref:TetR/AcrR family transcriptional regulator n=1 Tax=Dietzia sp. SLG310A2-38A2 TaxID=1630643 RepID=UPI0015F7D75F|nr:TetR/AcrR family transcriptional regulator [Dietzia sp. SLG310A2-38A2]MBB1031494.1 TetR/AcrR family transcriptional regulator [Dietzia sp. SLG310A2-38A2]